MARQMSLMESFSQRERFVWHDAFTVIIPNGSRTAYHPRASQSQLKALLTPQLRLTRGGNISSHQPGPPSAQPYDFYLAQLIHYGLDFHFGIDKAKRALEIEIILGRLCVPPGLMALEKELRAAHESDQNTSRKERAAKQQLRDSVGAAISAGTSEDESEHEPIRSPAAPMSLERKKQNVVEYEPSESKSQSTENTTSTESRCQSDDGSDTIAIAQDIGDSTSSRASSSSYSEEDVIDAKRPDSFPPDQSRLNDESSGKGDGLYNGKENLNFLDTRNPKRIKLEKLEEQKGSVFRSTLGTASSIVPKELIHSHAKVRRIPSQTQTIVRPAHSTMKVAVGTTGRTTNVASSGKPLVRKPFISPDKRPPWTIPVSSPSTGQRHTPKSVAFGPDPEETPTKVPAAEKAVFSSRLKPQRRIPDRTKFSPSRQHGPTTSRHSTLKKNDARPKRTQAGSVNGGRHEFSPRQPRDTGPTSPPPRRLTRQSAAKPRLGMNLDGAQDEPDMTDQPDTEKPYITSDVVNGKPSTFLKDTPVQEIKASFKYGSASAISGIGRAAVDLYSYHQQQVQHRTQAVNHHQVTGMAVKSTQARKVLQPNVVNHYRQLHTPAKTARKSGVSHLNDGFGHEHQMQLGSGSRGSLVRAGQAY